MMPLSGVPQDFRKRRFREITNDKGQLTGLELLDEQGNVTGRETYHRDDHDRVQRRESLDAQGQLIEFELWTYAAAGGLVRHELRQAGDVAVYVETWTRDNQGKLLYAESWHYDDKGKEISHKKLPPSAPMDEANPTPGQRSISAMKVAYFIVGGFSLAVAAQTFATGHAGFSVLAVVVALFNFWRGLKKR